MKRILFPLIVAILISGCALTPYKAQQSKVKKEIGKHKDIYSISTTGTDNVYMNLNAAIVSIADQLLNSTVQKKPDIILTSFVDLNQLNKSTTFGRLLGESMYNELHVRKFNVTDFRGQDAVSVNADGEFHITRDVGKLKDHIEAIEYIVVGTYVKFENNSVLINARIMDSESGFVISTARVIYKPVDCTLFDLCEKKQDDGIDITTDNCSKVTCPGKQCKAGTCSPSSRLYKYEDIN